MRRVRAPPPAQTTSGSPSVNTMAGMTGILLVHGAWHGPWCWDHFAVRLSECGHDVRAVQLRGHDQRPDRIWHRVRSYVDDLARAAAALPDHPVIVGHSLGGLVVQKYLERNAAPAAVLMASIPPGGTIGLTTRLIARHPLVFAKSNLLCNHSGPRRVALMFRL